MNTIFLNPFIEAPATVEGAYNREDRSVHGQGWHCQTSFNRQYLNNTSLALGRVVDLFRVVA